jgi:hypothetical protein
MKNVGIFYYHLVYLIAIWQYFTFLIYFIVIWYIFPFLVSFSQKNLATLIQTAIWNPKPFQSKIHFLRFSKKICTSFLAPKWQFVNSLSKKPAFED